MKLTARDMMRVSMFSALMVIGAYLKIQLPFIPVTLQGFFCAFAGILLGSRLGLLSQLIYIFMGLCGLPVFSGGGGITYVLKPSFGYIIGFALGTYVIGLVSEKLSASTLKNTYIALYLGLAVIYIPGIIYAYLISSLYLGRPDALLASVSVAPFLLKDIILFALAGVVVNRSAGIVRLSAKKDHA